VGSNLQFFVKNDSMRSILKMVPLMAGGYIFFGVASIYSLQITYARKSIYYLITYGGALVANVGLNLLFIDSLGILGVILASVLTKFLLGSLMVYFAQKSFKTKILKSVIFLVLAFTLNVSFFWVLSFNGFLSLQTAVMAQFIVSGLIIIIAVKTQVLKQYIFKNFQ